MYLDRSQEDKLPLMLQHVFIFIYKDSTIGVSPVTYPEGTYYACFHQHIFILGLYLSSFG